MNDPKNHRVDETACKRLEKSWFDGTPLEIEDCLKELPDEDLPGTTEELVCIEMEFFWKKSSRGEMTSARKGPLSPTSVEQYVQRFPQLDNFLQIERMVLEEISCRIQVNDLIKPAEYPQRFAGLTADSSLVRDRLDEIQRRYDTNKKTIAPLTRFPTAESTPKNFGNLATPEETHHGTSSGPSQEDVYIGRELEGYRILSEVGRGGTGVVYKAFDVKLKRVVALKILRNVVHADATELDRFLGEATAAAQINHPNIIGVYEIAQEQRTPFVVLEFASGGDLNDRIDGTPFAPRAAAELVFTLAQAIHAAHKKGIIHRDLKPGNIVFTVNDEVKITDFGLAKWVDGTSNLTQSGEIVGTPAYMAPEQIDSKFGAITSRTDVYALGVVLYELLTGRPPFIASSTVNTVLHVMEHEPVPPNKLQSDIGRDINTICLKCLEKQHEKRYASAEQLAADLKAYLEDRPITARHPSPVYRFRKWIRRHPATSGFLAVAAMAAIVLVFTGIQYNIILKNEKNKAQGSLRESLAQTQIAKAEKKKAEDNESRALHAQYVHSISLSQQDLNNSNFDGTADRLKKIKSNIGLNQHHDFELDLLESVTRRAYYELPDTNTPPPGPLERFAVHPSQILAVTGSRDGHLDLWNLQTRSLIQRIAIDTEMPEAITITTVQWLPTDTLFVTSTSSSGEGSGAFLFRLRPHPSNQFELVKSRQLFVGNVYTATVYLPNDRSEDINQADDDSSGLIALGHNPPSVPAEANVQVSSHLLLLDLKTGSQLQQFELDPMILSLAFSEDGTQLAVGTNQELLLYSRESNEESKWEKDTRFSFTRNIKNEKRRPIKSVLFWQSSNTLFVLAAGHNNRIRAWNLDTGETEFSLMGHQSMIQSISLDATTGRLASASNDRMILIWDLSQRNMIKAFDEHQAELTQVSFFDNAGKLASVSWDGRLIVRNLSPFHPTPFEFDENDIYGLATDTSQTHVVMVSKNNIGLWNIDDNPIQLHRHPEDPPKDTSDEICSYRCVISVPNNGGWLVGDQQGYIRHFVRKDDRLLEVPPLRKSENREVTDLVMHPDGHRFISVGKPQPEQEAKVEIWNLDIAESQPMDLPTFAHDLLAVTIDSTGRYIAYAGDTYQTADHDPSLFIYDLKNKQLITLDHDFPRHIFELAFQPDSLALAAVGDSNTITLFNGPNWKKKNLFYGHNYYIQSIVFSENGERIISVGNEGAVRIWDIELRTAVLVLPLPNARSANRLIFLEKQKKIIAGGEKIYSWNYAPQSDTD